MSAEAARDAEKKAEALTELVEDIRYSSLLWMPRYIRFIEARAAEYRALAEGADQ